MTYEDVVSVILGYLAEDAQCNPDDLRDELLAQGLEMPIDSLLAVDVLVRVQNATGVTLLPTEETATAMRSIQKFAELVCRHLSDVQSTEASA